jgi:hypothetical protein
LGRAELALAPSRDVFLARVRISALDQVVGLHAVELHPVEAALAGQLQERFGVMGSAIGVEADDDRAAIRVDLDLGCVGGELGKADQGRMLGPPGDLSLDAGFQEGDVALQGALRGLHEGVLHHRARRVFLTQPLKQGLGLVELALLRRQHGCEVKSRRRGTRSVDLVGHTH